MGGATAHPDANYLKIKTADGYLKDGRTFRKILWL